jgi:hypothetical protein
MINIKYRIVKGNPFYSAHMFYDEAWHYIQGTTAWTKYGCQKALIKHVNNQSILDKDITLRQHKVICEYTNL